MKKVLDLSAVSLAILLLMGFPINCAIAADANKTPAVQNVDTVTPPSIEYLDDALINKRNLSQIDYTESMFFADNSRGFYTTQSGQKGVFAYKINNVGNVTGEGVVTFTSSNPEVLEINPLGEWRALKPGYTKISYHVTLTGEARKKFYTSNVAEVGVDTTSLIRVTDPQNVEVYRVYNSLSGEHVFTADENEVRNLVKVGTIDLETGGRDYIWRFEGVAWAAPKTGSSVYRLYNPNAGDHHYTLSKNERDNLVAVGWKDEGIVWYSNSSEGSPIYRTYNPNAVTGAHHFTEDSQESKNLIGLGWRDEDIAFYSIKYPAAINYGASGVL